MWRHLAEITENQNHKLNRYDAFLSRSLIDRSFPRDRLKFTMIKLWKTFVVLGLRLGVSTFDAPACPTARLVAMHWRTRRDKGRFRT